jgi:hypothetical protein
MKDLDLNSNDEIEEAIALAWNDLTFDDMQSIFHHWMSHFV